ncbi:unnamed protein product [Chrysoparadoxa australica]
MGQQPSRSANASQATSWHPSDLVPPSPGGRRHQAELGGVKLHVKGDASEGMKKLQLSVAVKGPYEQKLPPWVVRGAALNWGSLVLIRMSWKWVTEGTKVYKVTKAAEGKSSKMTSLASPLAWFYDSFYELLEWQDPGIKEVLGSSLVKQSKFLMGTITAIGGLEAFALGDGLEQLLSVCDANADMGITSSNYAALGLCLLEALKVCCGEDWTVEIEKAWTEALSIFAMVCVPRTAYLEAHEGRHSFWGDLKIGTNRSFSASPPKSSPSKGSKNSSFAQGGGESRKALAKSRPSHLLEARPLPQLSQPRSEGAWKGPEDCDGEEDKTHVATPSSCEEAPAGIDGSWEQRPREDSIVSSCESMLDGDTLDGISTLDGGSTLAAASFLDDSTIAGSVGTRSRESSFGGSSISGVTYQGDDDESMTEAEMDAYLAARMGGISANILEAVGCTEQAERIRGEAKDTDWRPPEASGLANSRPLVKLGRLLKSAMYPKALRRVMKKAGRTGRRGHASRTVPADPNRL